MRIVTQQQRDNAIEALTKMWPSVPAANVIHALGGWRSDPDSLQRGRRPVVG